LYAGKLNGVCVALFVLLISAISSIGDLYAQRSDAMFWASLALDKDLDKKTQFNFKTQGRMRDNYRSFDYAFFDFGLSRKVVKGVKVDLAYVFNTKRVFFGEQHIMLPRHQVYGTVRLSRKWNTLKLMNRNRIQTQLEDGQFVETTKNTDYFYRNKTTLRWRPNKTWMPYCSYEAYFRLTGFRAHEPDVYRHRFSAGTYYYLSKRRRIDVYYLYQRQQRQSQPDHRHAIGISYEQSFKSRKKRLKQQEKRNKLMRKLEDSEELHENDRDPFLKW
jgi:hypothetical protein